MKKLLSLMLVLLCVISMAACSQGGGQNGGNGGNGGGNGGNITEEETTKELDVFEAAAVGTIPTNITSLTTYKGKDYFDGDLQLNGKFTLLASGNNSIFDFEYQRLSTVEEAAADYITPQKGAIAIEAGKSKVQIGDSLGEWEALIPSMQTIGAFCFDKTVLPDDYKLEEDGKKLTVSLTKAEALKVLGVPISEAVGEIALVVECNGKNLSSIVVSYNTASGASVRVATSYTYSKVSLDFSRFN